MRLKRLFGLSMAAVLALQNGAAQADGLVRDGIGAISTGRGGTNIGHSDNAAVLLDNPAGMINVNGAGLFEIGADVVITDLSYSDPDNPDVSGKFRPCPSPNLGYIGKSDDGRWAAGIGVFAPAGFSAEYDMNNPHFGESTYKSLGCLAKVLPGVAFQVNDQLSIGATLGVAFSQAELEGPFYPNSLPLAGAPTEFDLLANGVAPTGSVGLQYKLTPRTTIGACYTEETRFRLDGTVRADVPFPPAGGIVSSNFDAQVDLVWPRSFGVGLRHEVCACRRFSADLIWYDWSHAFDELDIKLTNSSHPGFAMFGPTIRDSLPLDWEDSVSLRLGYEWEPIAANIFRMGYVFHNSPVPDSTLNPYLDGVLTHALSAGYSREYERYVLNAAYQYSFSPEREINDSQLAGGDFNDSKFSAEAHWLSLSLLVPF